MATIYCYKKDCKNRSKRPSKAKNGKGEYLHKCLCKDICISEITPSDVDDVQVKNNIVSCLSFRDIKD